ncbi:HAD-IIB family hydrolase [Chloroflexota bacterium]
MQKIIFTDLDGTLLDENYSFKEALPALKLIKKRKIPLVFCTSKTEPEVKIYLKKMKLNEPFIVENGGAIFIPKSYFGFKFKYNKIKGNYFVIELGASYNVLKNLVNKIKKETKCNIIDFSQMSKKLVAKETGLTLNEAGLAKQRLYSFLFRIKKGSVNDIIKKIKKYKLTYTKGKIYHYLMSRNDKVKAVKILTKLYKQKYKNIFTIGLGNDFNDISMLKEVDRPFLIKNEEGYDRKLEKINNIGKIDYVSSKGWNKAISDFLRKC